MKYHVGQTVIIRDVNERGKAARRGTVAKVGRKLVTVAVGEWRETKVYRVETGRTNDAYGHGWIQTVAERAEERERTDAIERLAALHLRFTAGIYGLSFTPAQINAAADALTEPSDPR